MRCDNSWEYAPGGGVVVCCETLCEEGGWSFNHWSGAALSSGHDVSVSPENNKRIYISIHHIPIPVSTYFFPFHFIFFNISIKFSKRRSIFLSQRRTISPRIVPFFGFQRARLTYSLVYSEYSRSINVKRLAGKGWSVIAVQIFSEGFNYLPGLYFPISVVFAEIETVNFHLRESGHEDTAMVRKVISFLYYAIVLQPSINYFLSFALWVKFCTVTRPYSSPWLPILFTKQRQQTL